MKKVILLALLGFVYFEGKSQLTDAQLIAQADTIKNETRAGANTAVRVGRMFENIIYNKVNNQNIKTPLITNNGSDTFATNAYARSVGGGGSSIDTTRIPYLAKNNVFTGDNNFYSVEALSIQASSFINLGGYGVNAFSNDTSLSSSPLYSLPTQNAVKSYVTNHAPNLSGYQVTSNLSNDGTMAANSSTLYPTQQATRTYAAGLVVGLLNDRGSYDASGNVFPSTGGSGTAGAIQKGDLWYIKVGGTLGGTSVVVGSSVRALTNSPGQTSTNWDILNVGLGYVPENVANKSTNVASDSSSTTKYPTVQSVGRYAQSLSNLSNNATTDSASTTKYPSVQAITRFMKANNIPVYSSRVLTLQSADDTIKNKYSLVYIKTTATGNLYTNTSPTVGEVDYVYNLCNLSVGGGNTAFVLYASGSQFFTSNAGSSSATGAINVDSGQIVRLEYQLTNTGYNWVYTIYNVNYIPQDVNNLATSITPSDSASNTLYPSVNAVKNYVQANAGGLPYKVLDVIITYNGSTFSNSTLINTIGDTYTFSYNSTNGYYSILGATSGSLPSAKTTVITSSYYTGSLSYMTRGRHNYNPTINEVDIDFIKYDNTTNSLPYVTNFFVEVRVYP
jgi:hypothetical protein